MGNYDGWAERVYLETGGPPFAERRTVLIIPVYGVLFSLLHSVLLCLAIMSSLFHPVYDEGLKGGAGMKMVPVQEAVGMVQCCPAYGRGGRRQRK